MPLRCNDERCGQDATTIFALTATKDLLAFCADHAEMYTDEIRRVHPGGVACTTHDAVGMLYRGVRNAMLGLN